MVTRAQAGEVRNWLTRMPVRGIERVKRNFRAVVKDIDQRRTEAAVSTILRQGRAQADVMTPQDTGTLLNSGYQPQISQQAGKTTGQVGYTAAYASAVHNAPGKLQGLPRRNGNGNYWDPNAEPGFLEKGFDEIKPSIPAILRAAYRV
ncbi:hypothetical protein NJI34_41625 [Pseudomonas sp. S 311-6]|nr:hypothetical protein [Pseudomonas sp. S 311-6]